MCIEALFQVFLWPDLNCCVDTMVEVVEMQLLPAMDLMISSRLLWLLLRALKAILYVALCGDLNQGSRKVLRYLIMSSWKALHVPVTWSGEGNQDGSVSCPASPLTRASGPLQVLKLCDNLRVVEGLLLAASEESPVTFSSWLCEGPSGCDGPACRTLHRTKRNGSDSTDRRSPLPPHRWRSVPRLWVLIKMTLLAPLSKAWKRLSCLAPDALSWATSFFSAASTSSSSSSQSPAAFCSNWWKQINVWNDGTFAVVSVEKSPSKYVDYTINKNTINN